MDENVLITLFGIQTTKETLAFINAQRLNNKSKKGKRKW